MRKLLAALLFGMILGSLVSQPTTAQQVLVIFGVNSGVAKPISVDASGNVNAIGH